MMTREKHEVGELHWVLSLVFVLSSEIQKLVVLLLWRFLLMLSRACGCWYRSEKPLRRRQSLMPAKGNCMSSSRPMLKLQMGMSEDDVCVCLVIVLVAEAKLSL